MRKKPLVLSALLTGFLLSPLGSFDSVSAESNLKQNDQVKINAVRNIVSNFSYSEALIPDVKADRLNTYDAVYDFNNNHVGYAFNISNGNKHYYVVASNNLELEPILSFGEGEFATKKHEEDKIYYNGGFTVKTESDLSEQVPPTSVDAYSTLQKQSTNLKGNSEDLYGNYFTYDVENKNDWEALNNKNSVSNKQSSSLPEISTLASSLPSSYTIYADRYYQRTSGVTNPGSACGPTTGAMFAEYLKSKKGYNIDGLAQHSNSIPHFINTMSMRMDTGYLGTSPYNFATGFNSYVEKNYPWNVNAWTITRASAYGKFDEYKKEIAGYGFPVALYFEKQFSNTSAAYDYHYVLGVAYKYNSDGAYFGVKDPDGTPGGLGTKYFKWTNNNNYMTMIRANYNL